MWSFSFVIGLNILYCYTKAAISEFRYQLFGNKSRPPEEEEDVAGKVVVITGSQRGIGKADALALAKRNAIVIMGCLDMKEGMEAVQEVKDQTGNQNVEAIHLDLSDMDIVEEFAKKVARKYPKIKLLINNAGLGIPDDVWANRKSREGFNITVAVNHLGHFLLTNLLLNNLKKAKSARVVSMSSTVLMFSQLDADDLMMEKSGFGIFNALPYCNTKFANALFIKELGERLKGSGITTYALCPSMVKTQIFESAGKNYLSLAMKYFVDIFGYTPNEVASQFVMFCALNKKVEKETGFMYRHNRLFHDANKRLTPELRIKLWNVSARLVSLDERLGRFQIRSEK